MKLFALAATTAVTARDRWAVPRRVNQPAPGFVNEQGGYWADQPTQQSNQYRQPPQPSFQKPQCCQGYYHDGVFMEQVGENDMKPIYKGDFNGNDMYLFWHFDEMVSTPMFKALPGAWYFGSDFNDPTSATAATTIDSHALRYCPHDQINNWGNGMRFDCGQAPQPTQPPQIEQCCDAMTWETTRGDRVVMKKSGINDERPYYTGVDPNNGKTNYIFWRFDEVSDPRPVQAVPGAWYRSVVGLDDENPEYASNTLPHAGYRSCPTNQGLGGVWEAMTKLRCGNWPTIDTCETNYKRNPFSGIFPNRSTEEKEDGTFSECKVQAVMREMIGSTQLQQLLFVLGPIPDDLNSHFNRAVDKWQEMAHNSNCFTLTNSRRHEKGYIHECNPLCSSIQEISSASDFAPVLNVFAGYATNYMDTSNWRCAQLQQELFGFVSKFVPYVGQIENLPNQFM